MLSANVINVTGHFNAEYVYLVEIGKRIEDPIVVTAHRNDDGDYLIQLRSDHRLFPKNRIWITKRDVCSLDALLCLQIVGFRLTAR